MAGSRLLAASRASSWTRGLAATLGLCAAAVATAGAPPRTQSSVIEAARAQGKVVVYASTVPEAAQPLLDDFAALYPAIQVEYHRIYGGDLYQRFVSEWHRGESADLVWSSAMALQIKLANDGYALRYRSAEADALPPWASWRDEAHGTTYEPVVFAYDRRVLGAEEVPRSRRALARMLRAQAERLRGKVGSYDPERSGIGCLLFTHDARHDPAFDETLRAYGEVGIRGYLSSMTVLDAISAGELTLGVDVILSYALERQRRDPNIGIVYPADYTLVLSRVAVISRKARHPDAARLFLDYLLSERGQEIAAASGLGSVRTDLTGPGSATELAREHATVLRPIPVRPSVLVYVDGANREALLRRWRRATGAR